MKSVDFTVQRLLGATSIESESRLQYRDQASPDGVDRANTDHVVDTDDDGNSTGALNDKCSDDLPSRPRGVESLPIHPSVYLDYARQFFWQLTAAYRPG